MNEYLRNLEKIEFVVTYACTGRCKHCSEGDHDGCTARIDPAISAEAVRKIAENYRIKTVMTFGGEPLLHPDAVYTIMSVAKELNIPKRQVITNGYFTNDAAIMGRVAERLAECGVNDLLLSVDAFHQETISLETVKVFALELKRCGVPARFSPAWLVSREDGNPYNRKTRELLDEMAFLGFPVGEGNIIFPEGNAVKYLSEYFVGVRPENPYVDDPYDVRCVSFDPDGGVLGGNVYREDILEILENYDLKE